MTTQIHIFDKAEEKLSFSAGQIIFNEGDESKGLMYAIIEGEVDVIVNGKFLHTLRAGSIVGEMSLIDPAPRMASITARTDCVLVPVDAARFKFLVQQHPFFALDVMKILVERLREATELGVRYLS
jgi:CRP-like cAMP-binding protein